MYSWNQQRRDIQASVDQYFSRSIDISPRAMSALQAGAADENGQFEPQVFEFCVMQSLLVSSPSCATALLHSGVRIESLRLPSMLDVPAPLGELTLDWLFRGVDNDRITPTGRRVLRSGALKETDILTSALEAAQRGEEFTEFGAALLRAADIDEPQYIREYSGDPGWTRPIRYLAQIARSVKQIIQTIDSSHADQQFLMVMDRLGKIRVRPFGATELAPLAEVSHSADPNLFRADIVQPAAACGRQLTPATLEELEDLINSEASSERDFQYLFERYPALLVGLDFSRAHAQPILTMDGNESLVPDFFLERLSSGWDAIVDLKRPYDQLVTRRVHRTAFRHHVHNAVAQLRFYREWFDSPSNRAQFAEQYGVATFRPQMVIVIGRDHHFRDDIERIRLAEGLAPHTKIWTYDQVLDRARRYSILAGGRTQE